MADNVNITEGTGTVIATDQVGTTHFQKVKLVDGTAESTTVIAAGGGVEAGALRVTIASDSTGVISIHDNGGTLTVDGTVAATQSGTWNVGTVTAVTGITNVVQVGDNSTTLSVDDGGGALTVDGTVAATQSGTWNIGTVTAVTAISNALPAGTNAIGKLAANSGVDIGDVDVLSIAAGDNNIGNVDIASALPAGTNNIGIITPYSGGANTVMGSTAKIEDTNATAIIAAQGDSVKIYLTTVIVTNSDATVGTLVKIQDGADTPVVLCQGYAAPAGGGFVATFPVPPATTANKALNAICVTTSAEVYVSAVGFKGA